MEVSKFMQFIGMKTNHTDRTKDRHRKKCMIHNLVVMFVSTSAKFEVDSHHPRSEIIGFLNKIYFSSFPFNLKNKKETQ